MTAPSSVDPAHYLHVQLAQVSPDLLRWRLTTSGITRYPALAGRCARDCRAGDIAAVSRGEPAALLS